VSASLLEAMAVGLCPLVPDHPANRLWIEPGQNGVLLADLQPTTVAQAIRDTAADLALRRAAWDHNAQIVRAQADLEQNSRQFVERFRQLAGLS
jgi:glycosyltransferase involved in cell wall biosynthesis